MRQVSISQLKDQLSAYLKKVRAGETVVVMDRNTPVAQLTPLPSRQDVSERIARLEAEGVLLPPKRPPLTSDELRSGVARAPGAGVLEALLADRGQGW